jgi:hypothetical protein
MGVEITEFVEIDPERVDAVFKAANGTPFLMIKQVADDEKGEDPDDYKPDGDDAKKAQFCGDPTCSICMSRAAKGKLSTAQRRQIPKSDFAIPDKAPESGSYPINDKAHARNALSRVSQHGTPEEKARVRRAVASKFPDIGKGKKKKGRKSMGSQQTVEQAFHGSTPSPDAQQGQTKKNKRGLATNKDVQSDRPKGPPTIPDAGTIPQEATGFGRTAPQKESKVSDTQGEERAAEEQTRHEARKEVADMKGDTLEDKGESTDTSPDARGAQAQTEDNMRRNQPKGSDTIRDQMTRQSEQAQKGFKFKVKKTGKKKNKKKAPFAMVGALKQTGPERVLSVAHATKELDDMTGAEFAETLIATLDARDARKAEERKANRKAKKAKLAKKDKKAKKNAGAATPAGNVEAAQEAAKSISPEMLVEGIGARVESALKEAIAPLWGRMKLVEDQPARSRPALNNLAGKEPVMRDQRNPGGNAMDVLKPLEDAFKSEKDPYKREKMGGELTKARLVIAERIRHGQPVSSADAQVLAATVAR